MRNYEEIKHKRISDVSSSDLKIWVMDEVSYLANDFGQNMNDDILKHTANRLYSKLTTAYRSWYVGDVHAVFQTGLSGGYGAAHKVTVKTLFHFLKAGQNQKAQVKSAIAEAESSKNDFSPKKDGKIETEFLIWASTNMISLHYLDPDFEPLKEKRVSPKIVAMAEEYREAKDMQLLEPFKKRLKEESNEYYEKKKGVVPEMQR